MTEPSIQLLHLLNRFLDDVPTDVALDLCGRLERHDTQSLRKLTPAMLGNVPVTESTERFCQIVRELTDASNLMSCDQVSLFLSSLVYREQAQRARETVELVWTGPTTQDTHFRRTDQALLEVFEYARERVILVSFAIYRVPRLMAAIGQLLQSGITVQLVLEDKKEINPLQQIAKELPIGGIQCYVWPEDKRELTPSGERGAMHAKAAIADTNALFVSSANCTEYAMNFNMEMGLLIKGGHCPRRAEEHFSNLINCGILTRYWVA